MIEACGGEGLLPERDLHLVGSARVVAGLAEMVLAQPFDGNHTPQGGLKRLPDLAKTAPADDAPQLESGHIEQLGLLWKLRCVLRRPGGLHSPAPRVEGRVQGQRDRCPGTLREVHGPDRIEGHRRVRRHVLRQLGGDVLVVGNGHRRAFIRLHETVGTILSRPPGALQWEDLLPGLPEIGRGAPERHMRCIVTRMRVERGEPSRAGTRIAGSPAAAAARLNRRHNLNSWSSSAKG